MAVIKQLKNFAKTISIYPKTLIKAVYDENGNRLDNLLNSKSNKSSILGTVDECVASTTQTDVAGASAVKELNKNLGDKFAVATGKTPSSTGWSAYINYPTGFTYDNCCVISAEINYSNQWVNGINYSHQYQLLVHRDVTGMRFYYTDSYGAVYHNADARIVLMKIS